MSAPCRGAGAKRQAAASSVKISRKGAKEGKRISHQDTKDQRGRLFPGVLNGLAGSGFLDRLRRIRRRTAHATTLCLSMRFVPAPSSAPSVEHRRQDVSRVGKWVVVTVLSCWTTNQ